MAEAFLIPLAVEVVKSLGSEAVKTVASTWGFKPELLRLEVTAKTINNTLVDAERRQVEELGVRDWLKRLKVVLYRVQDLLEEFAASSASRKGKSFKRKVKIYFSKSNKVCQAVSLSRRIKEIRRELDDIETDSHRYTFKVCSIDAPVMRRGRNADTHSFINEKDVIGREEDKQSIMNMMFAPDSNEQNVSVISIVGMGGLGKTALAQLVYNDAMVCERFDLRLWVCVSDEFDLKVIVQKILRSATQTECRDLGMDQLQRQLRQELQGKKYLLVLDDVWNESREEWVKVEELLGVCGKGSKILVTTRLRRVAEVMVDGFPPYELKGLSEEESWSLFERMAFRHGAQTQNARLVDLGKEIVKKCQGVPLAIRTLGSYLYGRDEEKWLSVKNKELSQIGGEVESTMEVLKISYHQLWSPLKQCFVYCSLFPKDTELKKETLISLWMAQGFILPSDDQSLEETGEDYFTELLQRCFFQDIERDEWGNIIYCKMHDLMHDLAQQVSGGEIISAFSEGVSLSEGVSHVYFDRSVTLSSESPTSLPFSGPLRSLFGATVGVVNLCSMKHSSLGSLRVLDASSRIIETVPSSVGKLIHLRYLNLSGCRIRTLPGSIENLLNLQTLNLERNDFTELPTVIESLTSLRCLILKRCQSLTHLTTGISKLTNLRHLALRGCGRLTHMGADISKLTNLRHLDVSYCKSLTHLTADISNLTNLMHLNLASCSSLAQMPSGVGKLTKLRTLPLFVVGMKSISLLTPESLCGQFMDLKDLGDLRGELHLFIFRGQGCDKWDSSAANLRAKRGLLKLHVEYVRGSGSYCEDDVATMEGLLPHPNLKELGIEGYDGLRLPSSMNQLGSVLPHIVEIRLSLFEKCQHLPPFGQLASLKLLYLVDLPCVEYMESPTDYQCALSSEQPSAAAMPLFFPSLEKLRLQGMLNMKGWWKGEEGTSTGDEQGSEVTDQPWQQHTSHPQAQLPSFPKLISFTIKNCPRLTSSKPLSSSVERLNLHNIDEKMMALLKGNSVTMSSDPSSSFSSPAFSNLKRLEIWNPRTSVSSSNYCFKDLVSLRSLIIVGFDKLHSLSGSGLGHLTALESLQILNCEELDLLDDQTMPWKALKSLRDLELTRIPKMSSVPTGFQYLTALRSLVLSHLAQLRSLSGVGLEHLTSLESLLINDCEELDLLDDQMMPWRTLKNLRELWLSRILTMSSVPTGFQYLTALCSLGISHLAQLRSLSGAGLEHLTSLEILHISDCKELDLLGDQMMPWRTLKNLRDLHLERIPKMSTVPTGFRHLTALRTLDINSCGLSDLPEWVTSLPSLWWPPRLDN